MSAELLGDDSLYTGGEPAKRDITLPNGKTGTFRIRDLLESEIEGYFAERKKGDQGVREAEAGLVAAAIMEPDGVTQAITKERALDLKVVVRRKLVYAILEVNGLIDQEKPGN